MPGKLIKKIIRLAVVATGAFAVLSSSACRSSKSSDNEKNMTVYYLEADGVSLASEVISFDASGVEEEIKTAVDLLKEPPRGKKGQALLDEGLLKGWSRSGDVLTLDFASSYYSLQPVREVLTRAGIVRTLCRIEGVRAILFTVEGEGAKNADGEYFGQMTEDSFIEGSGKRLNTYLNKVIELYYANETGEKLRPETLSIYYSSSKPLEWAIVERIIAGPKSEGSLPVISSSAQIISVSTAEGVCYVNLSAVFLTDGIAVSPELTLQAIVNSLSKNCGVKAVQFAIDGETKVMFRDTLDLSYPYEPDETLIEGNN